MIKNKILNIVSNIVVLVAIISAASASFLWTYQPKVPKKLLEK